MRLEHIQEVQCYFKIKLRSINVLAVDDHAAIMRARTLHVRSHMLGRP